MAYVDPPNEPDHQTRRKLGLNKGQKAVDRLNAGFDAAIGADKAPKRPYETPQQRQARQRRERKEDDSK